MSETVKRLKLTPAQRAFLDSYLVEFEKADLQGDEAKFVAKVEKCNFDGDATSGEIRVALNLESIGILKNVLPHRLFGTDERTPCTLLSVEFTELGAKVLYERAQKIAVSAAKQVGGQAQRIEVPSLKM